MSAAGRPVDQVDLCQYDQPSITFSNSVVQSTAESDAKVEQQTLNSSTFY